MGAVLSLIGVQSYVYVNGNALILVLASKKEANNVPINQSFVSLKFSLSLLGLLLIILGYVAYYVGERKVVNSFVGFRIPPTYRDPEVWKAVNMRTGILFILDGIFMIIAGLILPRVELPALLLILLLPLAGIIIYGAWYAYQLEGSI